jgi:hypothetical protein
VLEILTQILHWPFESKLVVPGQFKQSSPELIRVFQLSYRLIKSIIREYRPNELYMSQWISLLIGQAMFEDPHYDVLYT